MCRAGRISVRSCALQPAKLASCCKHADRFGTQYMYLIPCRNLNLVVEIAVEYTEAMGGWEKVLGVLEAAPNGPQAEFAYLARRITTSEEPEEHYRCAYR